MKKSLKVLILSSILFLIFTQVYSQDNEKVIWNFEDTEGLKWAFNQFSSNTGTHGSGNPNSVVNPGPDKVNDSDSCASLKAEVSSSGNGIVMYIDYKGGAIDISDKKNLHVKMWSSVPHTWRAKVTDTSGRRTIMAYCDYTQGNAWQDLVFNFNNQFITDGGELVDSTKIYQIEFSAGEPFDLNTDLYLDEVRFNDNSKPFGYFVERVIWDFEETEGLKWAFNQFSSNAGTHGSGNPNSVANPGKESVNLSDSCASIRAEVTSSGNGIVMYIDYKGGAIDVSEMKMLHIKMKCDQSHTWRAKLTDKNGNRTVLTYSEYANIDAWQELVFNFNNNFLTADSQAVDSTVIYIIEFSAGEPFDLNTDVFLDEVRFNNDPNPFEGEETQIPITPILTAPDSAESGADYLVSWTESVNHTRYYLEEDTTNLFATANSFSFSADTTSAEFNHVIDGAQKFYYRVRAENDSTGLASDWSNITMTVVGEDTSAFKEFVAYDFEGINETVQWQFVQFTSVPGVTNNWQTFPSSAANPLKNKINPSDSCGYFTAEVVSAPQQITVWLTMPDVYKDVSDMPYLHIKMKCEKSAKWKVQLYDGEFKTDFVVTEYKQVGEWQDLVFDFATADLMNADLSKIRHLKFRYEGDMPFYADSLYFDDVKFSSNPTPEGETPYPTIPELIAPYAVLSDSSCEVSWSISQYNTGYVLEESEDEQFTTKIDFSFDDTTTSTLFTHQVTTTSRYYYRIKAINDTTGKESIWSKVTNTIIVPDTSSPTVPVLSSGHIVNSGETFEVNWTESANHTRYLLQEATTADFTEADDYYLTFETESKNFAHIVSDLTEYYFRIRAENEVSGNSSEWSDPSTFVVYPVSTSDLGCGTTYRGKIVPENYDTFPDIPAGAWWIEQPYNTKIVRCTDTGKKNNVYSYHRYSSVCVFNHTGDYFITFHREPEVWLHDGRNGVPLRKLNVNQTTCVWSMVEKDLIYFLNDNKFKSYNVLTDEEILVREFPEEAGMDFGGNEGDISNNGQYTCFSSKNRTRWFVYDIFNDIKHDVLEVTDPSLIDAAQISPSGKYVVIEYALKAANDYQEGVGCCLHDVKTMQYIRNLYYPKTQHNDVGFDNEGDEAMFIPDVHGDFAGGGPSSVVSIKMETAEKKLIHQFDVTTWVISHYSQRSCVTHNDYVFSSIYVLPEIDPNSSSWKPFWNEILAIPTDTSKETVRLAPTRVNMHGAKTWALEPRASVNRQRDRVVFTSNLNGDTNEWCDVFMITLEKPDTLPPLPPDNLTVLDNKYNEISIKWEIPAPAEDGDLPRNYKIYRDTTLMGYALDLSFVDTTVTTNTTYTYQVYSVDESAVESREFATLSVTTGKDTDPPQVTKVIPLGLKALAVHFDEPIDPATALDSTNYQFNNDISIGRMALACKRAVLIETKEQDVGKDYTISISGIRDATSNQNQMQGTVNLEFKAVEGSKIGFDDFSDNFDTADSSHWFINHNELWSFVDDMGRKAFGTNTSDYQSPGPGLLGTYALVKDKIYVDFTLTCDVRCPDTNSGADFAFVWNFKDNFNYNYVMFNRYPHLNELFVVKDTIRTTLTGFGEFTHFDKFATEYHAVKVQVKSGHFTISMDDSVVVEGDGETFLYGKAGIGSFNDWVYFDNFKLEVDKEFMTSVDEISNEVLPQVYKLNQNYPNPFNPATTISYSLPKAEKVRLTIYNLIGQQVKILIDKKQTPGEYKIIWDSQNLPSGIYFYELKTENFTQRKKMILIR